MVTADRHDLSRRAVRAFAGQTYPNRELIVLDNGRRPMESILGEVGHLDIRYRRLEHDPATTIGALRNLSLEMVSGDYVFPQWDDDDWVAPGLLARQLDELLRSGADACLLPGTVMHIDDPDWFYRPFYGMLREGTAILHRRDDSVRFPDMPTRSDTHYKGAWLRRRAVILPRPCASLYVRHQHGGNLWGRDHFLRRMQTTPGSRLAYLWYRHVRGNVFLHPAFRLGEDARQSFEEYLRESLDVGLFRDRNVQRPANMNGA